MKTYTLKDNEGNLTAVTNTNSEMPEPWFEVNQTNLNSGMVWNEETELFEESKSV